MAAGQKSRTPKTSKGVHGGGGKYRPTGIERVLMGQGLYRNIAKPNFGKKARDA